MSELLHDRLVEAVLNEATAMEPWEMREWAGQVMLGHHPSNQADNGYDRCALCTYTHHPCDVFDLAAAVWKLSTPATPDSPAQVTADGKPTEEDS